MPSWVPRESYTPAYRREAAHLVIDTGRTIAEVAREISVGEQLLGRWVAIERSRWTTRRRRSTPMSRPIWNGSAARMPCCGWIVIS